ncbi:hypothetical protein CUMW_083360, partial [Citrus unshiu]
MPGLPHHPTALYRHHSAPLCRPIAPLHLVTAQLHQELHQPTALHPKVIILSQPHTDHRRPNHQVVQECHLPVHTVPHLQGT